LEILNQYETLSQKLDINILNVKFEKDKLEIDFIGKFIKAINFLNFSEKMNDIISFRCEYQKK
jgi:hypothetical protein